MDLQLTRLDEDELLQLALQANEQQRHDQAISYLKEALVRNPQNATVLYLLGAEHAGLGLYQRAMQEMQAAIDLNPELYAARFQLGLLYLTEGMVEPCLETLSPLTALGEEDYFCCFANGLAHLIRDEFAACQSWLQKGIGLNLVNPALNHDMERILTAIQDKVEPEKSERETTRKTPAENQGAANSLWLSAYQKEDEDPKH